MPWLVLLRGCLPKAAFWWSCLVGLLFFLGSMWWLVHVTLFGLVLLSCVLALYFGLFGLAAVKIDAVSQKGSDPLSRGLTPLLIPAVWVALEYARSHLFSGFGWNLLAYSQTSVLPVIQIADVTGVWGVSFLIVAVNVGIAQAMQGERRPLIGCVVLAVAVIGYGLWRIPQVVKPESVRVAVVQGNVPQHEKWDEAYMERHLQRYEALTRGAAESQPELILWPETAATGYVGVDQGITSRLNALARDVRIPLVTGAPTARPVDGEWRSFNSAVLVDADGRIAQSYEKLHLVPYGEYVPFERWMPWLRGILPPIGDFIPGDEVTVFEHSTPFSVLVCFEDIFPDLARRFVRAGAQWLLVMTNDAWFGPTGAAYQHAQTSTFRAVELRVPVARAANTGWSGCIDASGRWRSSVRDASGKELFIAGTRTCDLPLSTAESLYLRWGDWFALLCLLLAIAGIGMGFRRTRNS